MFRFFHFTYLGSCWCLVRGDRFLLDALTNITHSIASTIRMTIWIYRQDGCGMLSTPSCLIDWHSRFGTADCIRIIILHHTSVASTSLHESPTIKPNSYVQYSDRTAKTKYSLPIYSSCLLSGSPKSYLSLPQSNGSPPGTQSPNRQK